ncbi:GNAT family N-acetyltransferase [Pseudonocardia sp.]|uniref:GNAT family N-acetyltransferase n=1 Tax=Pseudonocardia sp. TaxID=60912 RepID=UPI003D1324E7
MHLLPADDAALAAPFWAVIEQRQEVHRPAVSWAWTSAWLRHFGDTVNARFALVERRGEPVAAALLTVSSRSRLGARKLHLGTAGEPAGEGVYVEYNDVLCAPSDRTDVVHTLLHAIREEPGWDELDLPGMRPEAATAIARALPARQTPQASWTMRLQPDQPVLDSLKSPVRRLVRQARESLDPGPAELVRDITLAGEVMDEMALLHQVRWEAAGKPGVLAGKRLRHFLDDLVQEWLPSGRLMLHRLPDPSGKALGCVIGFVEDGRFLYYQAGFQRFPDNRKRAGLLCHVEFAETCRRLGMREYEFLAGDARYKRQLSGDEANTLYWSTWRRPSLRNSALDVARTVRDTARRVSQ